MNCIRIKIKSGLFFCITGWKIKVFNKKIVFIFSENVLIYFFIYLVESFIIIVMV